MNKIEKLLIATLLTTTLSTSFLSLADDIQPEATGRPFDAQSAPIKEDAKADDATIEYFNDRFDSIKDSPGIPERAGDIRAALQNENFQRNDKLTTVEISDLTDRYTFEEHLYNIATAPGANIIPEGENPPSATSLEDVVANTDPKEPQGTEASADADSQSDTGTNPDADETPQTTPNEPKTEDSAGAGTNPDAEAGPTFTAPQFMDEETGVNQLIATIPDDTISELLSMANQGITGIESGKTRQEIETEVKARLELILTPELKKLSQEGLIATALNNYPNKSLNDANFRAQVEAAYSMQENIEKRVLNNAVSRLLSEVIFVEGRTQDFNSSMETTKTTFNKKLEDLKKQSRTEEERLLKEAVDKLLLRIEVQNQKTHEVHAGIEKRKDYRNKKLSNPTLGDLSDKFNAYYDDISRMRKLFSDAQSTVAGYKSPEDLQKLISKIELLGKINESDTVESRFSKATAALIS